MTQIHRERIELELIQTFLEEKDIIANDLDPLFDTEEEIEEKLAEEVVADEPEIKD